MRVVDRRLDRVAIHEFFKRFRFMDGDRTEFIVEGFDVEALDHLFADD